jgi:hypothetical protein
MEGGTQDSKHPGKAETGTKAQRLARRGLIEMMDLAVA